MNTDTKRHIDSARQVLVGVVPNPTSQIDQITNALIYKFMDDMDQSAIKAGGLPSFFVDDLENYAWTRLMDPRMGNQERMNLYGEALIKFSQAKQLPELFRGIFKSAFLPYRSPETLGLFLKEIDYFDYSHPEELGNAYEYLLSIMSSQGDAGQFRTPRHIIDFIVDVVDPTKDDKVLDPACGTGGFLVSSYTHILEQHDGKDDPKKQEKPLTPDERKKLMGNFEGYDIDPTMVRIAQVNMYLHQFKNPKIFQYDSLSNEERWNDKFDVILANPPFMSPKGGIKPNSKFSIQSSRSEVLFVDYIMNHLRPKGRAGIIVPEGIIFQSGIAHKQLRKDLIEDGLYAVVSLPSGVFAPYSGVKTSILLYDNELSKKTNHILFVKIQNDGFDLGAQRRPVLGSDIPLAVDALTRYKKHADSNGSYSIGGWPEGEYSIDTHPNCQFVSKEEIAKNGDYNLSGDRYRVATDYSNAKWPMVELGDEKYFDIQSGGTPDSNNEKYWSGNIAWATLVDLPASNAITDIRDTQRKITSYGLNNSSAKLLPINSILVSSRATIGRIATNSVELATNQGFKNIIIMDQNQVSYKYVAWVLTELVDEMKALASGGTFAEISKTNFAKLKIPLPPPEIQEQIVAELDGYAGIIAGAKQIVQSWKPKIDIDPKWEKVKLGEVAEVLNGRAYKQDELLGSGKYPVLRVGNFFSNRDWYYSDLELEDNKYCNRGDLLYAWSASFGPRIWEGEKSIYHYHIWKILVNSKLDKQFLYYFLEKETENIKLEGGRGVAMIHITKGNFEIMDIPLPPLAIQRQIVEKIEAERTLVESAKKLIEIYDQKTKDTIAKLWED
ncbi:MAG: restriction endonuclease subunit S [Candidatus Roizmanbacteria bacterium]